MGGVKVSAFHVTSYNSEKLGEEETVSSICKLDIYFRGSENCRIHWKCALIIQSFCSVDSNFNVSFVQTSIETTND